LILINTSWENGVQQNSFLSCPPGSREANVAALKISPKVSPNPTNGSFVLSYNLEKSGQVVIDMYNSTGLKTRTLVNNYQDAGMHVIRLDMKDQNEKPGLYYIQLITDGEATTLKLMFIE